MVCCEHVAADADRVAGKRFTGHGADWRLLCQTCSNGPIQSLPLVTLCEVCTRERGPFIGWELPVIGTPEVRSRATGCSSNTVGSSSESIRHRSSRLRPSLA